MELNYIYATVKDGYIETGINANLTQGGVCSPIRKSPARAGAREAIEDIRSNLLAVLECIERADETSNPQAK